LARWQDDPWPGNVRGLRNAVARQIALGGLADGPGETELEDPLVVRGGDFIEEVLAMRLSLTFARQRIVDHFERRYVARVLQENGGNVVHAARASGIARRYFQKLKAKQQR